MTDIQESEARAIAELSERAAGPFGLADLDRVYSVVVPAGANQKLIDLEPFMNAPRRTRGTVKAHTLDALASYVERHDDPDSTTLWVDVDQRKVVAVLNDHRQEGPAWGDHRAELALRVTDAWTHWLSQDGKLLDQETFAEHIDDGLVDIDLPDGATMLEVAQSIQGTTKVTFKSAKRVANGQVGFEYVEEQQARAGQKGELDIPERFELAIAPFLGEDVYRVKARLRYRIVQGELKIGYRLDRPADIVLDALEKIRERLVAEFTADRVFLGSPR